ncbi:hypothetical protein [Gorillibacterium timonense]|uniref:hypothetical protein n=1 Tax=Gorillibacterium timonense TaxID=1689269 RepID=UPI0011DD1096|nr:hypothetical protein [Gorillibacterium timonense]
MNNRKFSYGGQGFFDRAGKHALGCLFDKPFLAYTDRIRFPTMNVFQLKAKRCFDQERVPPYESR